jgi:hypothetical protein
MAKLFARPSAHRSYASSSLPELAPTAYCMRMHACIRMHSQRMIISCFYYQTPTSTGTRSGLRGSRASSSAIHVSIPTASSLHLSATRQTGNTNGAPPILRSCFSCRLVGSRHSPRVSARFINQLCPNVDETNPACFDGFCTPLIRPELSCLPVCCCLLACFARRRIMEALPAGHAFFVQESSRLPSVFRNIFTASNLVTKL